MRNYVKNAALLGLVLFWLAGPVSFPTAQENEVPADKRHQIIVMSLENAPALELYQTILALLPEIMEESSPLRLAANHLTNSLVLVCFDPECEQLVHTLEALVIQLDQPVKAKKESNADIDAEIGLSLKRKVELAEKIYDIAKMRLEAGGHGGSVTAFHEAQAKHYRTQEEYLLWEYNRTDNPEEKAKLKKELQETYTLQLDAFEQLANRLQKTREIGQATAEVVYTALSEWEDVKIRKLKFEKK